LRLPAYSASAKVICFIGKLGGWGRGILPNQKVFFRVSLTRNGRFLKDHVAPAYARNSPIIHRMHTCSSREGSIVLLTQSSKESMVRSRSGNDSETISHVFLAGTRESRNPSAQELPRAIAASVPGLFQGRHPVWFCVPAVYRLQHHQKRAGKKNRHS